LNSNRDGYIEREGVVVESLPNATFRVKTSENDLIIAYISGKIRKNYIRILIGDIVIVQTTPYNPAHGRIIFRKKEI
jgi:translation initiation factor IF-1